MSFAPRKKVPFVLACFQVSAPPRLENPNSDKKDALFSLYTQITIMYSVEAVVLMKTPLLLSYSKKKILKTSGDLLRT
jgi:hypothetical protein